MFLCISSFMVFSVLLAGWSSNSKYSLVGSLRSVAQSISYESVLRTICVLAVAYLCSFSIRSFLFLNSVLLLLVFPIWFICSLAETHRAPFDFREAESELVSGFNTEYSGIYFAFIFLSEYGALLYSCLLIRFMFFYYFCSTLLFFVGFSLLLSFIFIWVRITFCRYRYDMLMMFSWKILLPLSLMGLISFVFLLGF
jgi:NADH-quinone oxidoreductase subunit H